MLTSRFVAGLQVSLQDRMVTAEGMFEQVLTKARFEEARAKELG